MNLENFGKEQKVNKEKSKTKAAQGCCLRRGASHMKLLT